MNHHLFLSVRTFFVVLLLEVWVIGDLLWLIGAELRSLALNHGYHIQVISLNGPILNQTNIPGHRS